MVWIPGGGNFVGAGSQAGYDGEPLARHGVVVVTIDYRLGSLGFLSHPALTRESPRRASGNQGILDQIAALDGAGEHRAVWWRPEERDHLRRIRRLARRQRVDDLALSKRLFHLQSRRAGQWCSSVSHPRSQKPRARSGCSGAVEGSGPMARSRHCARLLGGRHYCR